MKANFDHVKSCARCPAVVRMSAEQWLAERDQMQTTCPVCRAKLAVEAAEILERAPTLSQAEASTSLPPPT